jgi:YaiO family outer membrane protein
LRKTLLVFATSLATLAAPCFAAADAVPGAPIAPAPVATTIPWNDSLEIGGSVDSLTNGRPPQDQEYLSASERGAAGRATYYEQGLSQNQYGLHDDSLMAGAVLHATSHTLIGAELSLSPTHNVLPSFDGTASVEERFGSGFGTAVAYQRKTYTTVNASTQTVTLDRYFGQYYVAYRPTFAELTGTPGTAVTHDLLVTRYDNRGGNLTLNWYAGRDVESTGASSVLVLSVSGVSLRGHQVVAPNLAIAYGFEAYNEGSLFSATGGHVGLRFAL